MSNLKEKLSALFANNKDKISEIKDVISEIEGKDSPKEKQEFLAVTLQDGTEVNVEPELQVGATVTVSIPENPEPVPVPDGEHVLQDETIIITEAGKIVDILEKVGEMDAEIPEMTDTERQAKKEIERKEIERIFNSEQFRGLIDGHIEEKVAELTKEIKEENKKISEDFSKQVKLNSELLKVLEEITEEPVEKPLKDELKPGKRGRIDRNKLTR